MEWGKKISCIVRPLRLSIVYCIFQRDLVEIKQTFLQKYHKTLYKMIQGDCSGDYKKLLLTVVGMN